MKILHYSLGFDTDKGGGMTRYTTDIMKEQTKGNKVILLYPGEFKMLRKETLIKKNKDKQNIENYRVINPLPIPFLNGIYTKDYIKVNDNKKMWVNFFLDLKPDIFHIHTIIGLSPTCITVAKEMSIPMIYTTHDFFGICPKQTLYYKNKICSNVSTCVDCPECNSTALSKRKLFFLHSNFYVKVRSTKIVNTLKNIFKEYYGNGDIGHELEPVENFVRVRTMFMDEFSLIDYFHFNSSITELYFKKYIVCDIVGDNIPITLKNIIDNRKIKDYSTMVRLTYLGPPQSYKGYYFLLDCLDSIYAKGYRFHLNIFFKPSDSRPYFNFISMGYKSSDLESIYDNTDLLLVPSQCMETFGFVVREAMSFGTPVLVTDNVGAKDIIKNGNTGFIASYDKWEEIIMAVLSNKYILEEINKNIVNDVFYDMPTHVKEIMKMYENCNTKSKGQ